MADDEKEARATTLASQALELVASGRDEVCRCPMKRTILADWAEAGRLSSSARSSLTRPEQSSCEGRFRQYTVR